MAELQLNQVVNGINSIVEKYDTVDDIIKYTGSGAEKIIASRDWVNTIALNSYLPLSGGTLTGILILNADPIAALGATTKNYVDNLINGIDWKQSVRVATTTNITLSGTQTIDSIALIVGDRVLVKDQSTQSENGLYLVASGAWTRTIDANTGNLIDDATVSVDEGTVNASTQWHCNTVAPITIGVTAITWVSLGSSVYAAGSGLQLFGNVFSIATNGITDVMVSTHTTTKISTLSKSLLNTAIVYNDQANVYGDFLQTFRDDRIKLMNPANTFGYLFSSAAIAADRIVSFPLLTANDELTFNQAVQSLENKTLVTPIFTNIASAERIVMSSYINESQAPDIASAATTSIAGASQTGNNMLVTGTTTITSLGSVVSGNSARRICTFVASLTLTHNATSLILPSGANIQTQAGDTATFINLGGSNWKCVHYSRASGQPLIVPPLHMSYDSPTAADLIYLGYFSTEKIISALRAVLPQGTSTPTVTYKINYGTDISAAGTAVVTAGSTVTSVTTGDVVTSFDNATIPAGRHIWLTTSAKSGSVPQFGLTIEFSK